jgi:hypothetical protein
MIELSSYALDELYNVYLKHHTCVCVCLTVLNITLLPLSSCNVSIRIVIHIATYSIQTHPFVYIHQLMDVLLVSLYSGSPSFLVSSNAFIAVLVTCNILELGRNWGRVMHGEKPSVESRRWFLADANHTTFGLAVKVNGLFNGHVCPH